MSSPAHAVRHPGRRWVLVTSLAALAVVLAVGGLLLSNDPVPQEHQQRPSEAATTAPASSAPTSPTTATQAAPSPPVSITIADIAVSSDLLRLGMNEDRTVEVPQDASRAGWYDLGTSPGQRGSAVILGHVDSTEGPAVFYRLRELTPGARVEVALADGAVETFEVSRVETIANDDFPAQKVYAGTPDRPTLAIVTCGGDYDKDAGGYQSNVIAYAEHVDSEPAA